jgi:hypothetical protein
LAENPADFDSAVGADEEGHIEDEARLEGFDEGADYADDVQAFPPPCHILRERLKGGLDRAVDESNEGLKRAVDRPR